MSNNCEYEILILPNGKRKYVKICPKTFNPGFPGRYGGLHKCSSCGKTHNVVGCPLYHYNHVIEYSKEEFMKKVEATKSSDEKSKLSDEEINMLEILNKKH